MTKAAPKKASGKKAPSKSTKKKSESKKPEAIKKVAGAAPQAGHNSGTVNKPLIAIFEEYELLEENKKQISKAQADLKAKAKEEHSVQKTNFMDEVKMRKLDAAVRAQFEQSRADLKVMLGYQFALNLVAKPEDDGKEAAEKPAEKPKPVAAPSTAVAGKTSFFKPAPKAPVDADDEDEQAAGALH